MKIKESFLDLFFPKTCLFCQREGEYLCQDCFALLEISEYQYCLCKNPLRLPQAGKCRRCQKKSLNGLYFALSYQNSFCQKLIRQFKYENAVKELAKPLSSLIIAHFQLSNKLLPEEGILIPVPLTKKRLKWRGFHQAEEIAKELSNFWEIPLILDCLIKVKENPPQVDLSEEERMENIKGVFQAQNEKEIMGKKIFLVDDVYTTGATMEGAARILKTAGVKEVWGVVVARG